MATRVESLKIHKKEKLTNKRAPYQHWIYVFPLASYIRNISILKPFDRSVGAPIEVWTIHGHVLMMLGGVDSKCWDDGTSANAFIWITNHLDVLADLRRSNTQASYIIIPTEILYVQPNITLTLYITWRVYIAKQCHVCKVIGRRVYYSRIYC